MRYLITDITENPLPEEGELVFGKWIPPFDSSSQEAYGNFEGCLDEIMFWDKLLDNQEITAIGTQNYHKTDSEGRLNGMKALFKFDTAGRHFEDEFEAYEFEAPPAPFSSPEARLSGVPLSLRLVEPVDEVNFNAYTPTALQGARRRRSPPAVLDPHRALDTQTVVDFTYQLFFTGPFNRSARHINVHVLHYTVRAAH